MKVTFPIFNKNQIFAKNNKSQNKAKIPKFAKTNKFAKSTKTQRAAKHVTNLKLKNFAAFAVIAFFAGVVFLPAVKNISAASSMVYEIRSEDDIVSVHNDILNNPSYPYNEITLKVMNDIPITQADGIYLGPGENNIKKITITADKPYRLLFNKGNNAQNLLQVGSSFRSVDTFELNNIVLDYENINQDSGGPMVSTNKNGEFIMSGKSEIRNMKNPSQIMYFMVGDGSSEDVANLGKFVMKDDAKISNISYDDDDAVCYDMMLIYGAEFLMQDNAKIENINGCTNVDSNYTLIQLSNARGLYGDVNLEGRKITMRNNASIKNIRGNCALSGVPLEMSNNAIISENDIFSIIHSLYRPNDINDEETLKMSDSSKITRNNFQGYRTPFRFLPPMYINMSDDAEISHNKYNAIRVISQPGGSVTYIWNKKFTLNNRAKISYNEFVDNGVDALFEDITTLELNDDSEISNNKVYSGYTYGIIDDRPLIDINFGEGTGINLNDRAKINNNSLLRGEDDSKTCSSGIINVGYKMYGSYQQDILNFNLLTMNDQSEISGNYSECGSTVSISNKAKITEINLNSGTMANNKTLSNGGAIGYPGNDAANFLERIHVGENFTFSGNRAASLRNIQPEDQALHDANIKTKKFSAGTSAYNNFDIEYLKGEEIPFVEPNPENPTNPNANIPQKDSENSETAKNPNTNSAKKFKLIAPNTAQK